MDGSGNGALVMPPAQAVPWAVLETFLLPRQAGDRVLPRAAGPLARSPQLSDSHFYLQKPLCFGSFLTCALTPKENFGSLGTGVTSSHEAHDVGSGN